jgi:hypothetical protein
MDSKQKISSAKVSYPGQTADETMLYAATSGGLIDGLGDVDFIS